MADAIEGRNAVLEALRAGMTLQRVMIAVGTKPHPSLDEIRRRAEAAGVPVQEVARDVLDRSSSRGVHQGVMAYSPPFRYARLGDVLTAVGEARRSLVVVLDHVTDPGNLGSIIRTVEVAGGDAIVIPADRASDVGPIVHKAAAGATAHLPIARVPNVVRALESLKDAGYWVAGADERAEHDLWSAPLEGRLVLVMGSEGRGLARLTRERCDFLVSVPVAGRVSSLNVAQAAAVLCYEWVRRGE